MTQTTWKREKKETKSRNREEIKAAEEKKGKSPNQSQKLRQETNRMEKRKKKETKSQNREEIKLRKKKKKGILMLTFQ